MKSFRAAIRTALGRTVDRDILGMLSGKSVPQGASSNRGKGTRPIWMRFQKILSLSRQGALPNASRMATELGVCTKTIHRDLECLRRESGLELEFDPVRNDYVVHVGGPVPFQ